MMNIGKTIKTLRDEKRLTQKELADLADLSVSFINQLEGDKYLDVGVGTLDLIAKALGTTVDVLVTGFQRTESIEVRE